MGFHVNNNYNFHACHVVLHVVIGDCFIISYDLISEYKEMSSDLNFQMLN